MTRDQFSGCASVTLLLFSLLATPLAGLGAQETRPRCRLLCGVDLDLVRYLGDADEAVVDGAPSVAESSAGYVVAHRGLRTGVMRFSSTGEYLGTLGRAGQGPGEFQRISTVTLMGDEIWLWDIGNQRFVRMSLDGTLLGETSAGWATSTRWVVPLSDGTVVLNAHQPTPELVAHWVHRVDPVANEVVWSKGDDVEGFLGLAEERVLAASTDGGVWVARSRYVYEIYHLSAEGERTMTITPTRDWFTDWAEEPEATTGVGPGLLRPTSRIFGLYSSGDRLIVIGATGDRDWSDASAGGFLNIGRRFDSVVEVFDTRSGELLSSRRFDLPGEMLVGFTN